jgi:hypothetical protein
MASRSRIPSPVAWYEPGSCHRRAPARAAEPRTGKCDGLPVADKDRSWPPGCLHCLADVAALGLAGAGASGAVRGSSHGFGRCSAAPYLPSAERTAPAAMSAPEPPGCLTGGRSAPARPTPALSPKCAVEAVAAPRCTPMCRTRSACWARTASGHAVAAGEPAMKSLRPIHDPAGDQ